jgi:dinuclear metal center YbgI/SA1388 family protein
MTLQEILRALETIAPLDGAEKWDNVGLLAGDPRQTVSRVMICIDYTDDVASEARLEGCELVIAYHPPIFKPIPRVVSDGPTSLVFDAIRRGVAIYSPHTALDVAEGGTNDVLADLLGLVDRQPLRITETKASELKLETFVPPDHLEAVARAMFAAGAGVIGDYTSCSFRTEGTGTFFGEAGSRPTVGQAGELVKTGEIKIETIVPTRRLATVVAALRAAHPYEEPAFDLVQLAAPPTARGIGRIGRLDEPLARDALIGRIKEALGIDHVLVAGPTSGTVHTAAVCAGSCGDLLDEAIAKKVDLYLTGEMRHHDALRAAHAGVTVVCALHSNSERVTLKRLADRLAQSCPSVAWRLSQADRDPFAIR